MSRFIPCFGVCVKSLLLVIFVLPGGILTAGDWPQILGPHRNGIADADENLVLNWKASGPKLLWQKPVGTGVAGVSVQGTTVVLFHRLENKEHVVAFDKVTGQKKWEQAFETAYIARIVPDNGPLCVPTIAEKVVIVYGASGRLHCLDLRTGKVNWTRETHPDYGANEGYFGTGSSPIVYKNLVLVNVGGFRQNAGVVAFHLQTGKTLWKNGAWKPGYSSPVLTTFNKQPLVIFVTREQTVGLHPETGAEQFSFHFGQRGPTVNGANPVVMNGHLFLTASYGIGNVWAKIESKKLTVLREGLAPLASQYTTPVVVGKSLVGIDGRQDGGESDLVCFDPATGKEFWRKTGFGYATIIKAGSHLLIMKSNGELIVAEASLKRYNELHRVQLSDSTVRAMPALSDGKLYIRDEKQLKCYAISN
ncbi:MAG: PQQ-binding-like beta-propeller repeat protein [Planctomycetaceae bacterium]|nr:PQQ-binding-like beta-propeller repeat protein [Planctomycetaceae bacterium]